MEKLKTPKYHDLIYDVGLHCGEDTDFYLRKGFRVVALEANPELVQQCRSRFHDFVREGRLKIVEGAVVEPSFLESGQSSIRFYRNQSGSAWGTVRGTWADRNERSGTSVTTIEVDVIDFAAVLQENGIPHYMKIDIEGCDTVCLNALKNFQRAPRLHLNRV